MFEERVRIQINFGFKLNIYYENLNVIFKRIKVEYIIYKRIENKREG